MKVNSDVEARDFEKICGHCVMAHRLTPHRKKWTFPKQMDFWQFHRVFFSLLVVILIVSPYFSIKSSLKIEILFLIFYL